MANMLKHFFCHNQKNNHISSDNQKKNFNKNTLLTFIMLKNHYALIR